MLGHPPLVYATASHSLRHADVSPVAFRAQYAAKFDANEADYYGALTAMDAQIGRIRAMLRDRGVADDTLLVRTVRPSCGPHFLCCRRHTLQR